MKPKTQIEINKPEAARKLKALIYGAPGVGKTTFIGTAQSDPRLSPVLLLDFEGGSSALAGLDIDVIKIRDWQDYNAVYAWLANSETPYKCIGIDSISETYTFAQLTLVSQRAGNIADPDMLQLQEWGKARIQMQKFLRSFRDLPKHVIFTAGVKRELEPREGEVAKPFFAGSLSEEVMAMMDAILYMGIAERPIGDDVEVVRVMILHSVPKFRCKIRTPFGVKVPEMLYEPTATKLLDILGYK